MHANSEYVQKLTKVFAKSMYPMKETQPHKSLLFVFFFWLKKICAKFQHFLLTTITKIKTLLAHETYVGFRDLQRHETQNQGPTEAKLKGQEELP